MNRPAIVRRNLTSAQLVEAAKAPGRPRGRVPGGWIADLCGLGKSLCLCDLCAHKFRPQSYDYERRQAVPGHDWCIGECDGCREPFARCGLYLPQHR